MQLEDRVLNSGNEESSFSQKHTTRFWGSTQPHVQSVSGFVPGIKLPGREADHSVVEVKNECSCTSGLPLCIHGVVRDKFAKFVLNTGQIH